MPTTPTQLNFTEEVDTSTPGDTIPTSSIQSGSLVLFSNGGNWYSKNSSGTVTLLTGAAPPFPLTDLAAQAADTIVGNGTGGSASPTALSASAVNTLLGTITSLTGGVTASGPGAAAATVVTNANLTGPVTSVGNATTIAGPVPITALASQAADSFVMNNTTGSAVPTAVGQGLAINRYDVTKQGANSVLASNTAAQNRTALIALVTGGSPVIPVDSVVYFPPGNYQFDATSIGTLAGSYAFEGVYGWSNIELTGVLTSTWITASAAAFYLSFRNLSWINFASQTTTVYIIDFAATANAVAEYLQFTGSSSNHLGSLLNFSDTSLGGDGAKVCYIYAEYFGGTAINVAGANSSMYMEDLLLIGENISTSVGISYTNGGATMMSNCQVIKTNIGLALTATSGNTIASIQAVNSFFDQCLTNALQITNSGTSSTVTRSHFIGCWFTTGNTNSSISAISIGGTNNNFGLKFVNCFILNTQATATSTGITVASTADIIFEGNAISGYATGFSITPTTTALQTSVLIANNNFGASGQFGACTTGIVLNVGAPTTYGNVIIEGNNLAGTTTALTDNATSGTGASFTGRLITANTGLVVAPPTFHTPTAVPLTTVTQMGSPVIFPANARIGTKVRLTAHATCAATAQTLTPLIKFGTNNTNADTTIAGLALGAGTAAAGAATIVAEFILVSATTAVGSVITYNGGTSLGTTGVTNLPVQSSTSLSAITISNISTLSYLAFYMSSATASAVTVQTVEYEVTQQ